MEVEVTNPCVRTYGLVTEAEYESVTRKWSCKCGFESYQGRQFKIEFYGFET